MSATLVAPQPVSARDIAEKLHRAPESTRTRQAELDLLAILEEQAIRVYPSSSVEAYKRHKQTLREAQLNRQSVMSAIVAVLLLCAMLVSAEFSLIGENTTTAWVFVALFVLAVSVTGFFCTQRLRGVYWIPRSVPGYEDGDVVPLAVRELIGRLAPLPKGVRLSISSLQIDPILEVWKEGVCCIIAIWDKPGLHEPLLGQ